jgi:2-iminobutanoate/2-iminopropanoate deaminase
MTPIQTNKAAQPLGHYEQAIEHNGIIYISGQLAITPEGEVLQGSIEEQTELALKNLIAVAEAAGSSKEQILKTTIFISNISLWAAANEVYSDFFGSHKPARSAVPTRDLPKGLLIEIEAIACK